MKLKNKTDRRRRVTAGYGEVEGDRSPRNRPGEWHPPSLPQPGAPSTCRVHLSLAYSQVHTCSHPVEFIKLQQRRDLFLGLVFTSPALGHVW